MGTLRFVARRALLALPIVAGVLLFTFLLIRVGSNDPIGLLAGPTATAEDVAAVRRDLQLDQPVWRQFAHFAWRVAHGELGTSWLSGKPVFEELTTRLAATLELVLLGALIGAGVGVPLGLAAAMRPGRWVDHGSRIVSLLGFGMPTIFLGLAAIFVFFYLLGWSPPPLGRLDLMLTAPPVVTGSYLIDGLLARDGDVVRSAVAQLVLPVGCVALVFAGPLVKQTRAIALDVLASDYVRFAEAAGLPRREIARMVWRNSAVPIVTYGATELTALFGVASVLELIFSWGGVSQFGLTAILRGDFAVVQGYVLLMSLIAVVIFAAADLVVIAIEPRAREAGHA